MQFVFLLRLYILFTYAVGCNSCLDYCLLLYLVPFTFLYRGSC